MPDSYCNFAKIYYCSGYFFNIKIKIKNKLFILVAVNSAYNFKSLQKEAVKYGFIIVIMKKYLPLSFAKGQISFVKKLSQKI